ncbi:MAG: helix-turn-helix transcriptional regulator [Planctomycetota bacterium]
MNTTQLSFRAPLTPAATLHALPKTPEPLTTTPGVRPINDPDVEVVKSRLRRARRQLALSQRQAAQRAGVSKSVLEKYESREDTRIPNTRQLFRLALAYGVSIDYLLGRIDDAKSHQSA